VAPVLGRRAFRLMKRSHVTALLLCLALALLLPTAPLCAADAAGASSDAPVVLSSDPPQIVPAPKAEALFQDHEFQIDLLGGATSEDLDQDNVELGAGAGVSYYITDTFGFGVSAFTTDKEHHTVDQLSWDVLARQPIGDRVAPYLFVGGDYNFERDEWLAHSGAGLEIRLIRHLGTFAEARWETDFVDHDQAVGRAGVRLSF